MRFALVAVATFALGIPVAAQTDIHPAGPTDAKAQKAYADALDWLKHNDKPVALNNFKKADQQDGGHCAACQKQMMQLGEKLGDYKTAEFAAAEQVGQAHSPAEFAEAHMQLGAILLHEGSAKGGEVPERRAAGRDERHHRHHEEPRHCQRRRLVCVGARAERESGTGERQWRV